MASVSTDFRVRTLGSALGAVEIQRHCLQKPWRYSDLDRRQREIAERVRRGGDGAILLSEVAPVITLGRRTQDRDILGDPHFFSRMGVEIHPTDRGGLATYHGPGQWILFPVNHLQKLTGDSRGVRKGVMALLEIACQVGRTYDSSVEIREGCELGVWTARGKFAAVGIHIEKGVLLHGLAINGFKTASSFVGLRPCGLDAPIDFLMKDGNETDFLDLGERILQQTFRYLGTKVDCNLNHSYNR